VKKGIGNDVFPKRNGLGKDKNLEGGGGQIGISWSPERRANRRETGLKSGGEGLEIKWVIFNQ